MNTPSASILALILTALLFLPGCGGADETANAESPDGVKAPEGSADVTRAHEIVTSYKALGARLQATLADKSEPIEERVDATLLLGQMRYLDAVPTLIAHIGKTDRVALIHASGIAAQMSTEESRKQLAELREHLRPR